MMGGVKAWMMEQQAQGFYSKDTYVCANCVDDDVLIKLIKTTGSHENACSYCKNTAKKVKTIKFDEFIKLILMGIRSEWGDPNNEGVGWEHGWMGDVLDTYDIFAGEIDIGFTNDQLQDDLIHSLSDHQWCQKNFYQLKPHEALTAGWREFTRVVKHESRYVFLGRNDSDASSRGAEEIPPADFLDALGEIISRCNLYTILKTDTEILRLRLHTTHEGFTKALELGAPPPEFAKYANRMSAAGIPAFYGAFDKQTAIKETVPEGNKSYATIGKFKSLRDLVLIDFTKLPPIPSIFEPKSSIIRHGLQFLRGFLDDFTSPIEKDGREHIEYVPTQIVAEYLRFIHQKDGNINIDGILYRSSRNPDSAACVLFIDFDQSVDPGQEKKTTTLVLTEVETFKLE